MHLLESPAHELAQLLQTRAVSSVELVQASLDRIDQLEPQLQALIRVLREEALTQAASVDEERAAGVKLKPLAGIPILVKDILCTQDIPTTCASKMLEDFVPTYNAAVVDKILSAGMILLGKTNLDEFAMGSSTENSSFHLTRNPWNIEHSPGGSSGGSAASVAAGYTALALGTDTGGSIRQPASYCGVVGLKPTYGRVSRYGMIAFASSLDQIGPITRTVTDSAHLLNIISGHDQRDSTSVRESVPDYTKDLDAPGPLKVGVIRNWFQEGLDPEIAEAVHDAEKVLRAQRCHIVDIELPHTEYAIPAYYIVATAEASGNLARYEGVHYGYRAQEYDDLIDMYSRSRSEGFGEEVKRRIMLGTYVLSSGYYDAYYLKALKVRRLIREDFDRAFESADVLLGPTAPSPSFKIGSKSEDPLSQYLVDIYTTPANLAGIAGVSVPAGFSSQGLPLGIQFMTAPFQEAKMLQTARLYERETEWTKQRPSIL